jgi:hypothetical protein
LRQSGPASGAPLRRSWRDLEMDTHSSLNTIGQRRFRRPMRQTTTPAPASDGGSPPCCSSATANANAPGLLMFVPGGLDPAIGALDDVTVQGLGCCGSSWRPHSAHAGLPQQQRIGLPRASPKRQVGSGGRPLASQPATCYHHNRGTPGEQVTRNHLPGRAFGRRLIRAPIRSE